MKHLAVLFVLIALLSFAIDKPGKDPEESWNELIALIKSNPNSPAILAEGPKIAAKRRLAQLDLLKEAVITEDMERFLASLNNLTSNDLKDLRQEVLLVFPDIVKVIEKFENGQLSFFDKIKSLWKLGFKMSAPMEFTNWLIENFLKNPQILDWNTVGFIGELQNKEIVSTQIVQAATKYSDHEIYYPHLYRILEIARNARMHEASEFELQLISYINLLNEISRANVSYLTKNELENMLKQFDSIKIKKDLLRDKLVFLIVSAQKAKVPMHGITVQDLALSSLLKSQPTNKKGSTRFWILLPIVIFLCCLMVLIDRVRLKVLLILRARKAAARTCQKILSKDPFNFEVRSKLALLYEEIGDLERAVLEYKTIKDLSRMTREQQKN